jgi:hypothetical protein
MQRNGVISLRTALEAWRQVHASSSVDQGAVYGCVDWYLYHEEALTGSSSSSQQMSPPKGAAPTGGAAWPLDSQCP